MADRINRAITDQQHLAAPGRTFRIVRGTTDADLDAVVFTIRVLSEHKLVVAQGADFTD